LLSGNEQISTSTFSVSCIDNSEDCCNLLKIFCSELVKTLYFRLILALGSSFKELINILVLVLIY